MHHPSITILRRDGQNVQQYGPRAAQSSAMPWDEAAQSSSDEAPMQTFFNREPLFRGGETDGGQRRLFTGANFNNGTGDFSVAHGPQGFQDLTQPEFNSMLPVYGPVATTPQEQREAQRILQYEQKKQEIDRMLARDPDIQFFNRVAGFMMKGTVAAYEVDYTAAGTADGSGAGVNLPLSRTGPANLPPSPFVTLSSGAQRFGTVHSGVPLQGVSPLSVKDFRGPVPDDQQQYRDLLENLIVQNNIHLHEAARKKQMQSTVRYMRKPEIWGLISLSSDVLAGYDSALGYIAENNKALLDPSLMDEQQKIYDLGRELRQSQNPSIMIKFAKLVAFSVNESAQAINVRYFSKTAVDKTDGVLRDLRNFFQLCVRREFGRPQRQQLYTQTPVFNASWKSPYRR